MIAAIVDKDALGLTILDAGNVAADAGFPFGAGPEAGRVWQHDFQKLNRGDGLPIDFDRLYRGHTHIFQHP